MWQSQNETGQCAQADPNRHPSWPMTGSSVVGQDQGQDLRDLVARKDQPYDNKKVTRTHDKLTWPFGAIIFLNSRILAIFFYSTIGYS